jgi:rod shape-determining protein MreB
MRVLDILRPPLVAIDVGTSATRVSFGAQQIFEGPSSVCEDVRGSAVTRPTMRGGVVSDIAGAADVLAKLLASGRRPWQRRPAAIVCAPSDVTADERDALIESVTSAGASVVAVISEPLAAALGAGVDVASEYATAVVDIGEGVTDFAVFRNATIVRAEAMRTGCGTLRAALGDWWELQRGDDDPPSSGQLESIVRGWCASDGAMKTPCVIPPDDLDALLEPVVDDIAGFVANAVRRLPDALAAEIIESGICVTGGGAKLDRLVRQIERRTGLPLTAGADPLGAVIRGATGMLRNRDLLMTGSASS